MNFITKLLGGSIGVAVIVLLVLIAPMLMLWSINTLSEQSGSSLYIGHGFWSYVACFVLIGLLRGGK
jgi:hypothetical protein